jgi:hypothetical protein
MTELQPIEWIKVAVANSFGLDKKIFSERLDWFDMVGLAAFYSDKLVDLYANKASEPMMFRKMVNQYKLAIAGQKVNGLVGLDSTTSGVQILSALMACRKGCIHTNLINDGERHDLYGTGADFMSKIVGYPISRDDMKPALMTFFYGSTEQPKILFGDGTKELKEFYNFLRTELEGAYEAMNDMGAMWDVTALSHSWVLPDGHVAYVPVMEPVDKRIEIDELDHSTFTQRAYVNQPSEYGRSIMANIVHSIDGYVVREMIRMANQQSFKILTIHDSFWCHPKYVNLMRKNYNYILSELCRQDVLSGILSQLAGEEVEVVPIDDRNEIADLILNADYAIN